MALPESSIRAARALNVSAWLISLTLLAGYVLLPTADEGLKTESSERSDEAEEPGRIDILDVSPRDPYVGSSIAIVHSGPTHLPLQAFLGKTQLAVIARRGDVLVAQLPDGLAPGDLKVRVATAEEAPFSRRAWHSKPFRIRVREPSWRKVFRHLAGGVALVVLGVGFLASGTRGAIGLGTARALAHAARRRELLLGAGALLGALAQSTAGAASVLSALVTSRVLSVVPAALAFLGAGLGAALAPLLLAGLVEPREGLLALTLGVAFQLFGRDRRARALARLLLGVGFVAFGLQIFRPGLEPFVSDAVLLSLAERVRAATPADLALCALLGSLLVAGLQGPGPLIVLLLGVAQATGRWDLRGALALLAGTGLGAALSALVTVPAGARSRALAQLHLVLGVGSSLFALATVDAWAALVTRLLGPAELPLHFSDPVPISDLGMRLAVAFGLSQLGATIVLLPLAPLVGRWLEQRAASRKAKERSVAVAPEWIRSCLGGVFEHTQASLSSMAALAVTGIRKHGIEAEQHLRAARDDLDRLLAGPIRAQPLAEDALTLARVAYAALQLQHALEESLQRTERMIEARIGAPLDVPQGTALSVDDERLLRGLHRLLAEGLEAVQASLLVQVPFDLEGARAREIRINRLEADARRSLSALRTPPEPPQLTLLQLVDAYESSGNQVYRLSELMGEIAQESSFVS